MSSTDRYDAAGERIPTAENMQAVAEITARQAAARKEN
jgi:hypothetical protein